MALAGPASAQYVPAMSARDDTTARADWIQWRLDAETGAAQRWYWFYFTASGGATLGQVGLGLLFDDLSRDASGNVIRDPMGQPMLVPDAQRFRPGFFTGAINGLLGWVPMILFPFRPAFAAAELRSVPAGTSPERAERLRTAERLLRECAEAEEFGHSWVIHTIGIVLGAASSAVLWLGFHQAWYSVGFNFVATVGFNELQLWTQPRQAVRDWRRYRRGEISPEDIQRLRASAAPVVMPTVTAGGAGLALVF